jgi:hypothetical protein
MAGQIGNWVTSKVFYLGLDRSVEVDRDTKRGVGRLNSRSQYPIEISSPKERLSEMMRGEFTKQ